MLFASHSQTTGSHAKPSPFAQNASLDLRFDRDEYLIKKMRTDRDGFGQHFLRSSAAIKQVSNSQFKQLDVDQPRIIQSEAIHTEPDELGLVDPINMSAIINGVVDITPYAGTHLGLFNDGITIASRGALHNNALTMVGDCLANDVFAIQALIKKGTSPSARIHIGGWNNEVHYYANAYTSGFQNVQRFSNSFAAADPEDMELIPLGDNYYILRAKFTASRDYTNISAHVGPHSAIAGETVHLIALDVKISSAYSSFTSGLRSSDRIQLNSDQHDLNFTEGAMFWKGKILEQSNLFPRLALLGKNWNEGIQFLLNMTNNTANISLRSGAASVASDAIPISQEYTTYGVTWRPDGTTRIKVGSKAVKNQSTYLPPNAINNLYINCAASSSETVAALCKRFVGFSTALTDDEFDQRFAEIAA